MADTITVKFEWQDNSSGDRDEDGQELEIYTDSPTYKPNQKIDYSVANHAWMRLPPIAAGETEASMKLKTPVTFVKFRVRQYNENAVGDWSTPVQFSIASPTSPLAPNAPSSLGFSVVSGVTPPPPPPPPDDPPPPPPPTGGTGVTSNYTFSDQFSGVQGQNQWSYLDAAATPLVYNASAGYWLGAQTYQGLWRGGLHPGTSVGTVLRWTAPADGEAFVSGSVGLQTTSGSNGIRFTIKHNSSDIDGPVDLTTTTLRSISEPVTVVAGDTIDFIVAPISGNNYCSTSLMPIVLLTTDGTTPAEPTLGTLSPSTIVLNTGGTATLTISITTPAPSRYTINLASSDPTKVTVASTVSISTGQTSASVLLTAVAVGASIITASRSGSSDKTAVATVSAPVSGNWVNAPAGGTVLLDHAFNSMSGLFTPYANTVIVSDSSAPFSPSNVARTRLEAFAKQGGDEVSYTAPVTYREMFFGLYWRTNPQFQGRISGNKLFFLRGPGTNGVFYMVGGPNMGASNFSLVWSHNSGHLNNSHIMGGDAIGNAAFGNVNGSSSTLAPGLWYKLECHIRASTTSSSRDGFIRWWINNTLTGSYDSFNYAAAAATSGSPGMMNQWVWNQTWDGSGDMGTSNTVPWEHYVDHVYLVGKN